MQVCLHRRAERFFRAFHKVTSTAAVHVHLYAPRHNVTALCINNLGIRQRKITIGDLNNLVALHNDRSAFQPSGRCQDSSVYNLLHIKCVFKV